MEDENEFSDEPEEEGSDTSIQLISKPVLSAQSSIDENIITLEHSYGYDCKKMFNLVLIDANTLVFASGNLIHFFDIQSATITTRRSACGGGIGSIAKNPIHHHLTVAENGNNPTIFIYKFPEMEVVSILKKGTKLQYSIVDYTADGKLLGSQGGSPDYTITIWDWERAEIKLRAKSFSNDVLNLMFSPAIPEQITTCGLGHIKFWKMSETFTGLKLQGLIGRFGKTEICDIYGICPLPDEKVLSGSEWGNVLVWEAGLVKMEVCRKNRRPCHNGPIAQIFLVNSEEIMTVGTDGLICIWYWETVELSDPPEHDRFVEIEPSHEFRIGNSNYNAELLKIVNNVDDWYAQDGKGGIWWCDLSTNKRPLFPRQLFRCHAGEIIAMDTSSVTNYVCTLGADGRLYIYNYLEKRMIFHYQFLTEGRDLIWLNAAIDETAATLILGFSDGVIRIVVFDDKKLDLKLIQVVKCHCRAITKIGVNAKGSILISAAEDSTIFIHQLGKFDLIVQLNPIGFVRVPSPVSCINWDPQRWSTAVFGCYFGDVVEVDLPELPQPYNDTTYHLAHIPIKTYKFKSIKSAMQRNAKLRELEAQKEVKRRKKIKELEKMRQESPGDLIDEETFLADSEDEEPLEKIFIPDPPNKILFIQFTKDGSLWLSVDGFDAGFIYEYSRETGDMLSHTPVPFAEDIPIYSYIYFGNYCILGMGDGKIRINRMRKDWRDLNNFWILSMHDNFYGEIPAIKFSYDDKYLFSIGVDGNLFSYNWNLPVSELRVITPTPLPKDIPTVHDIDDPNYLSLEQEKEKENFEWQERMLNDKKSEVLSTISELRNEFEEIVKTNSLLPDSQRLTSSDMILDTRINNDLQQKLDIQMDTVRRKKEFDFEKAKLAGRKLIEHFIDPILFPIQIIGIKNHESIFSFRFKKLGKELVKLRIELEMKIREAAKKKKIDTVEASLRTYDTESSVPVVESFLIGLNAVDIETKIESKMRRLLNKYRERKAKERARKKEWEVANNERPNPEEDHPDDIRMIDEAKQTIGDYKLKSDLHIDDTTEEQAENIIKKLSELIKVREDIFNIRNRYNVKVFKARDMKKDLMFYVERKLNKLKEIQLEIDEKACLKPEAILPIVAFDFDREYPERNLDLNKYLFPDTYDADMLKSDKYEKIKTSMCSNVDHLLKVILHETNEVQPCLDTYKTSQNYKRKYYHSKNPSDWEEELLNIRSHHRLYQQKRIFDKVNARIDEFDNEIEKISQERYEVEVKAKFKEIFLLTLNQELLILKDFEQNEDALIDEVERKAMEKKQLSFRISNINSEIEMRKRAIEEMRDLCRKVEHKFRMTCLDVGKFAPFLRKIFHRDETQEEDSVSDTNDDRSVSSPSTTSSDREHLEDRTCPKGCDKNVYELTFELRREHNEFIRNIAAKQKELDAFQLDLDMINEKFGKAKRQHADIVEKLVALRRRKQEMLNDVNTIVLLKMDQMQYFKNQEEFVNISNTLLFNNHNVTRLYSRVGKLALETIEAKRSHRINVIHLAKMKSDIKFMEKQIVDLKDGVNEAMLKKFGRIVDLNDVEETILRRFAFEMQIEIRANTDDIKKQYVNKINELKKLKITKQNSLTKTLQEATEKLNILAVLEEEKNYLERIISTQNKKKEGPLTMRQNDVGSDLDKLKEICSHQKQQIEMLQREIRALSLKTKSFVEARRDMDSFDYNIRQISGECRVFEDSLCSNAIESMVSSTRATTPDEIFNDILKMLVKFMQEKNLKDSENEMAIKISKYLSHAVPSYQASNENEEVLTEILQQVKSFLPSNADISQEDIITFIANVIGSIQEAGEENQIDVLKEIINNTIETANQTAISSNSYLQHILSEIFKALILAVRIPDDISEETCSNEVLERLSKISSIGARYVNVDEVVAEIHNYSLENLDEDIDTDLMKRIILNIMSKL